LRHSSRRDHRHRIEHFTLAGTDHIKQARKLGLIVVANPSELNFYGDSLVENLGIERARDAFPLGSLLGADVPVAMGSDRPCANGNPLVGIQAAVVRRTHSGRLLGPDQSIRVVDAFRMYTQKAAYAAFEETLKGTLEIGKYADLAVFYADPFKIPVAELVHLPIAYTIVGGQVVYADAPY
jgi:predicted amidohydrolase YtcJ